MGQWPRGLPCRSLGLHPQRHPCGRVSPGPGSCLLLAGWGSSPGDWGDARQLGSAARPFLASRLPSLSLLCTVRPTGPNTPARAAVFPPVGASCPLLCILPQPRSPLSGGNSDFLPHPLSQQSPLSLEMLPQLPLQSQTVTCIRSLASAVLARTYCVLIRARGWGLRNAQEQGSQTGPESHEQMFCLTSFWNRNRYMRISKKPRAGCC